MKLLRERARICGQVRQFFDSRGFIEVATPLMVPSPGLDLHLEAFELVSDATAPRWLITSPEYQMKRLLADGWTLIYQLAPCFRRSESGARHNPEFTMLEWYRGGADVERVIADTEQLVAKVTGGALRLGGRIIDVRPPFERLPVCEAFARFARWSSEETLEAAARDDERYFRAFVDCVEPGLEELDRAVFLTDYPASQASLARTKPNNSRLAERFELHVAGVELCNGFGELTDPVEQRERFVGQQDDRRRKGLPVYPIDERFLQSLSRIPPSAGNALGFERLVALTCGATEIAAALAFTVDEL